MRRSSAVRAMGPTTPIQPKELLPGGKCPVAGIRPGGGLSPQMPQKRAGARTEPPPALPIPPKEQPDAEAAASPPPEAAPRQARFPGLLVGAERRLLVS